MDTKTKSHIAALEYQRNEALNRAAIMNGTIAALQEENGALIEEIKSKTNEIEKLMQEISLLKIN